MSNTILNTTPSKKLDSNKSTDNTKDPEESKLLFYIIVSVCILGVIFMIWYAYTTWVNNSEGKDGFSSKDSPVMDFNLKENIEDLEKQQSKILDRLSKDTGI
jgi:hypothetical protein